MRNEQLMGIARGAVRGAPVLLVLCALAAAALAYTVRWHQTNTHRVGKAPFSLIGQTPSQTVRSGGVARYRIAIRRGRYHGRIKLTVVTAHRAHRRNYPRKRSMRLKVRGRHATLIVRTSTRDRPGAYAVAIRAVGGRYRGVLTLPLTIRALKPASFAISGSLGQLWPGTSRAVNLGLTNPNGAAIVVRNLVLKVSSVSAPRATGALPCSVADFSVTQFTGSYPLRVAARATRRLSDLGVATINQPQITMLNRPVNQNGCQGATITLSYSGTATSS